MKTKPKKRDWPAALKKPAKRIPWEEMELLWSEAGSWRLCATGVLCNKIPRLYKDGPPMDRELRDLGMDFCAEVCDMRKYYLFEDYRSANRHRSVALSIHRKIEKRAAEILASL